MPFYSKFNSSTAEMSRWMLSVDDKSKHRETMLRQGKMKADRRASNCDQDNDIHVL